jgi:uncharacterized MnhB-related membrane protein
MLFEALHIILPIFIILAALISVFLKDLLASVVALAGMSLLLSLEFFILHAPDVAIAEAGVGACLTTAIFILAIKATKRHEEEV